MVSLSVWAYFWCIFFSIYLKDLDTNPPEKSSKGIKSPKFGLKCTDLSIGNADEPLVDQFVCFGVSRLSLHDVALSCLISQ